MSRISDITSSYRRLRIALPVALLCLLVGQVFTAHLSFCRAYVDTRYITTEAPIMRNSFLSVADVFSGLLPSSELSRLNEPSKVRQIFRDSTDSAGNPLLTFSIEATLDKAKDESYDVRTGTVHVHPKVTWTFHHKDNTYYSEVTCGKSHEISLPGVGGPGPTAVSITHAPVYSHPVGSVSHPNLSWHPNLSCTERDTFDADEVRDIVVKYVTRCGHGTVHMATSDQTYVIARDAFFSYILDECTHRESLKQFKNNSTNNNGYDIERIHSIMKRDSKVTDESGGVYYTDSCSLYEKTSIGTTLKNTMGYFPKLADFRAINLPSCDRPWTMFRSNTKEEYALIEYFLKKDEDGRVTQPTMLVVTLTDFDDLSLGVYVHKTDKGDNEKPARKFEVYCDDIDKEQENEYYGEVKLSMDNTAGPNPELTAESSGDHPRKWIFSKWKESCIARRNERPSSSNTVSFEYFYEKFGDDNRRVMKGIIEKMLNKGEEYVVKMHLDATFGHEDRYGGANTDIPEEIIRNSSFTYSYGRSNLYKVLIEFHYNAVNGSGTPDSKEKNLPDQTRSSAVLVISIIKNDVLSVVMVDCPVIGSSENFEQSCNVDEKRIERSVYYDRKPCGYTAGYLFDWHYGVTNPKLKDAYTSGKNSMPHGDRYLRERIRFIGDSLRSLCE